MPMMVILELVANIGYVTSQHPLPLIPIEFVVNFPSLMWRLCPGATRLTHCEMLIVSFYGMHYGMPVIMSHSNTELFSLAP